MNFPSLQEKEPSTEMPVSLPQYPLEIRLGERGHEVWDPIRRQWMVLTPEEQVRQCLILYLSGVCGVPRGLMSLERGLQYDRRRKRYDLLVHDRAGKPFLLCECKEPRVPIDDAVLQQAAVYNSQIGARMLLLVNGPTLLAYGRKGDGPWAGVALPDPQLPGGEAWFEAAMAAFSNG